jgi:hypothetical protein
MMTELQSGQLSGGTHENHEAKWSASLLDIYEQTACSIWARRFSHQTTMSGDLWS